jgi:Family of unknown function (DUF5989)
MLRAQLTGEIAQRQNFRGAECAVPFSCMKFLLDLGAFLRARKNLWLLPILLALLGFAALTVLAESSGLGPFLYSLF